jgi:hypothetical protein
VLHLRGATASDCATSPTAPALPRRGATHAAADRCCIKQVGGGPPLSRRSVYSRHWRPVRGERHAQHQHVLLAVSSTQTSTSVSPQSALLTHATPGTDASSVAYTGGSRGSSSSSNCWRTIQLLPPAAAAAQLPPLTAGQAAPPPPMLLPLCRAAGSSCAGGGPRRRCCRR